MRNVLMSVVVVLSISLSWSAAAKPHKDSWMVGFWHMTKDEDGDPVGREIEFRADGNYVAYDHACKTYPSTTWFLHNGDIFVVYVVPAKGPVAQVFHPNSTHSQLTYTSIHTKNNATFERKSVHHCGAQG